MAFKKSSRMDFNWNYNEGVIVQRKGFGKDLNKYFADVLVSYSETYTPWSDLYSTHLRNEVQTSATTARGIISYPGLTYANYQYLADDSTWHRYTALTCSRWCEYAYSVHKAQITGKVGAYKRWHSK